MNRRVTPPKRVTLPTWGPVPRSSHAISVKAFRRRTPSDHVTRKALAARNNEAYGQGNGRQSLDTGILLLAVFTQ